MMATSDERKRQWELEQEAKSLEASRDEEYREAKLQWENTVGIEINRRWQPMLEDANRKVWEAMAIADAVDVATAEKEGKYKPGTVLVNWQRERRGWHGEGIWKEVGRGVVEVMKPDTILPGNVTWRPMVGTLMVRVLKKDGTPGKVVKELGNWRDNWLPEGKKPK